MAGGGLGSPLLYAQTVGSCVGRRPDESQGMFCRDRGDRAISTRRSGDALRPMTYPTCTQRLRQSVGILTVFIAVWVLSGALGTARAEDERWVEGDGQGYAGEG